MRPVADGKSKTTQKKVLPAMVDTDLFTTLRRLRKKIADEMDLPPYIIFSDATLREMAARKPRSLDEFHEISGVGERKLQQYGETFIEAINEYLDGRQR
jgi:ATP-dependent DNA helicase RecQ